MQDFSEWAQCQVLEAVSGYQPTSEQEVFDIMNVLDDRLLHSNSAVVMATVKLFLHLTLSMPPTHQQVTFFTAASAACVTKKDFSGSSVRGIRWQLPRTHLMDHALNVREEPLPRVCMAGSGLRMQVHCRSWRG